MTTPAPPTPAPAPGSPSDPGQQPTQGTPPAAPPAPAPPPVPQPPTWSPPPPAAVDDGGIDDISKLPKKWQKELTEARGDAAKYRVEARTERVKLHAYTTAAELGVNPSALLGSTAFVNIASQLDPAAEDFPAKLASAVQAALKANPWMAAQQTTAPPPPPVPSQSGGDFSGSGGPGQIATLDQQIADAEKAGNHALAISLKRQRSMLSQ